ncbi:Glycosyl transferase family 9 [Gammaproteobacteria bacterium]
MSAHKILAIQFKYLGDVVFITPALFALKKQFPEAEIHVLVAREAMPILEHIPWISKVWGFPRTRGKIKFSESWPVVQLLRREKFDRSVDFCGNDRGALLSFLIGAKIRIASFDPSVARLRKAAYTQVVSAKDLPIPWVDRHLSLISKAWNTPIPEGLKTLVEADPRHVEEAKKLLQGHTVLCHVGTSQPKKEWPTQHWFEFFQLATDHQLIFSSGRSEREQKLLTDLQSLAPDIFTLPPISDLALFLAVLKQARVVISGDTAPLHFAAGLDVKTIGLFGTEDSVRYAAPLYSNAEKILGNPCMCTNAFAEFNTCQSRFPCMASITPEQVLKALINSKSDQNTVQCQDFPEHS